VNDRITIGALTAPAPEDGAELLRAIESLLRQHRREVWEEVRTVGIPIDRRPALLSALAPHLLIEAFRSRDVVRVDGLVVRWEGLPRLGLVYDGEEFVAREGVLPVVSPWVCHFKLWPGPHVRLEAQQYADVDEEGLAWRAFAWTQAGPHLDPARVLADARRRGTILGPYEAPPPTRSHR
jgi:hypothetical protein